MPWDSGLELHAAGALYFNTGSLSNRGSTGYFWSNAQNGPSYGMILYLNSSNSSMTFTDKANGLSIRCIRD